MRLGTVVRWDIVLCNLVVELACEALSYDCQASVELVFDRVSHSPEYAFDYTRIFAPRYCAVDSFEFFFMFVYVFEHNSFGVAEKQYVDGFRKRFELYANMWI